jgi:hypothetical protein
VLYTCHDCITMCWNAFSIPASQWTGGTVTYFGTHTCGRMPVFRLDHNLFTRRNDYGSLLTRNKLLSVFFGFDTMRFESIMACLKFNFLFLNICENSNEIPVSVERREIYGAPERPLQTRLCWMALMYLLFYYLSIRYIFFFLCVFLPVFVTVFMPFVTFGIPYFFRQTFMLLLNFIHLMSELHFATHSLLSQSPTYSRFATISTFHLTPYFCVSNNLFKTA